MTALLLAVILLEADPMSPEEAYESHTHTISSGRQEGTKIPYRLLKPASIDEGQVYPLVLFLHGRGESGDDNVKQLKYFPTIMAGAEHRKKYPCFVVAPQCPAGDSWAPFRGEQKPDSGPNAPLQGVMEIFDAVVKSQPVDVKRIYLTGLSMGGYGSWDLASRQPERFAAVVPICGGGSEAMAARLTKVPIWAWHGSADGVVPPERSRRMIEAIRKAGGEPKYTELEGVGHDSWTPAYTAADGPIPWMFEQRRGS